MRVLILCTMLLLAVPTVAFDFDLGKLDLNKIGNMVKHGQQAFTDIPEPEEIQIGGGMAAGLLGAVPLVRNERVQRYVNDLGQWLAMHSERPGLPWRFGVLDTSDINAFAAPGGYVFITRGLFMSLWDEAELAGVIGHEIIHVLQKHHLQAIKARARAGLATDALGMAADQAGVPVEQFTRLGMDLFARGLDKEDEFEADRRGVVLAARGGYDPEGLPGVLYTINNMNPKSQGLSLMFQTHPPTGERIQRLEGLMDGRFLKAAAHQRLRKRLQSMQALLCRSGPGRDGCPGHR